MIMAISRKMGTNSGKNEANSIINLKNSDCELVTGRRLFRNSIPWIRNEARMVIPIKMGKDFLLSFIGS